MPQRFYPAVLERGEGGVKGVWFPDFPGVVAVARSQEEAMAKAEQALAEGAEELAFEGKALPEPTALDEIELPKGCDFVAFFAVGVEPPDQSERINVYLPKSLIVRVDRRAAELGMSRSSFFGWAVTTALSLRSDVIDALPYLSRKRGK
jgi:predicted RNase H-like HicB family nuclease